jgi:hypothetical protein
LFNIGIQRILSPPLPQGNYAIDSESFCSKARFQMMGNAAYISQIKCTSSLYGNPDHYFKLQYYSYTTLTVNKMVRPQAFVNYVCVYQRRLEQPLENTEPPLLIAEFRPVMSHKEVSSINSASVLIIIL